MENQFGFSTKTLRKTFNEYTLINDANVHEAYVAIALTKTRVNRIVSIKLPNEKSKLFPF